jgi:hypothetical protein
MTNKKIDDETLAELIETAKQISLLIEDNNQNIKDCRAVLKRIESHICPKQPSILVSAIRKLLNIH